MSKIVPLVLIGMLIHFSGCSKHARYSYSNYQSFPQAREYSENPNRYSSQVDSKWYKHPTMKPYVRFGVKYYPAEVQVGEIFDGVSSWYGPDFHGKLTSNGEHYDMYAMTAAHKTFPMNTIVKVTNKDNGKTAVVRINDRGPFVKNRIIDLSNTAARKIDMVKKGTANVELEILGFYSKNKKKIVNNIEPIQKKYVASKKASTKLEYYSLQIASFTNFEGALGVQEKYDKKDGYESIIRDIESDEGRFFKVFLIGFKSEKEVRDYKVNSEFQNAFIVKEE